jgi:hypothetical protein
LLVCACQEQKTPKKEHHPNLKMEFESFEMQEGSHKETQWRLKADRVHSDDLKNGQIHLQSVNVNWKNKGDIFAKEGNITPQTINLKQCVLKLKNKTVLDFAEVKINRADQKLKSPLFTLKNETMQVKGEAIEIDLDTKKIRFKNGEGQYSY